MSGIVGGINSRSGLVNLGSSADGQLYTGTGLGMPVGFEAAAGGGGLWQYSTGGTLTARTADFETPNFTGNVRLEVYGFHVSIDGNHGTFSCSTDNASSWLGMGFTSILAQPTANTTHDNHFQTNTNRCSAQGSGTDNGASSAQNFVVETINNDNSSHQMAMYVTSVFNAETGTNHRYCDGIAAHTTTDNMTNFKFGLHDHNTWYGSYRLYTKIIS